MRILGIYIDEFGGLVDKKIELGAGLNLLTGENEAGKSTVCAFIKYVFYGFCGTKEKERYTSLDTGRSSGALMIEHNGGTYRIERSDSGNIHNVTVYNEETSALFADWRKSAQTPGEYFLGVGAELYVRSVYVSQDAGTRFEGGAEAVSNLLLSGDESVNLRRAQKSLDAMRKALKLKKGVGGLISEVEARLEQLKSRKNSALRLKRSVAEQSIELNNTVSELLELKSKLENARIALDKLKNSKIRIYLAQSDEIDRSIKEQAEAMAALKKSYTYNGYLPTDDFESKIIAAERDIRTYLEQSTDLQAQLERMKKTNEKAMPEGYDTFCAMGKRTGVHAEAKRFQASLGAYKVLIFASVFVFMTTLVALLASALDMIASSGFLYVMLGSSLAVGAGAIFLRHFPVKKMKILCASLGAENEHDIDRICSECEAYENKQGGVLKGVNEAIALTRKKLFDKKTEEAALLKQWGKDNAEQALSDYKAYYSSLSELRKSENTLATRRSVLDAYLAGYTEAEIEEARRLDESDPVQGEMRGVTEETVHELEAEVRRAEERKHELEVALANAGAAAVDIAAISGEIELEEKKLAEYTDKFRAVTLATEALEQAESNVRLTVSPYLSERSGELFAKMTDGKYTSLRVDPELNVGYISAERTSVTDGAYFSCGSAELAWFCLRLALHERLSASERIPMILDECFVYFDDIRLERILKCLEGIASQGTQILLFSASSREKAVLSDSAERITL